MEKISIQKVWLITSEISQFLTNILDYNGSFTILEGPEEPKETEMLIESKPISEQEEVGSWEDGMSIVKDFPHFLSEEELYDDYDNNHDNDNCDEEFWHEAPTYGRYAGSYAQEEMGYSDDDIDTIFDGDPSAYWNID